MKRRDFLTQSAAVAGVAALGPRLAGGQSVDPVASLKPLSPPVPPITDDERLARIEKARALMRANGMAAMFLEGGSSMFYYTGVRWGNSERPFGVVIPVRGELAWVTPGFEEQRARELIKFSNDVRVWQEDESPYRVIAGILRDRGVASGTVGMEERVRFFIFDGVRRELPSAQFVIATPVTAGCRMIKSPAEIALMQRANDITLQAIGASFKTLKEGITQQQLSATVADATRRLGGASDGALVIFGKYTAFPHGSVQPQKLRDGDVVLIDAGCTVDGYTSDITRTTVFGKPTQRMRDVWALEKRAQSAAFAAAKIGATCESVDAAARKVISDAGFGPGYKVPGLPHRTGHGIGLDGHEWTNFVRGNTTKIQPGMCFSDEPTIVIYGEFGIRLEDCLHITESGPKFFTPQSPSIEQPV
ncbi:MAG TPA: Xaa-Pro peptidase family protein [Gemmatimonadaceae bacterium]|jgi:Xaa-Pro aminopeptidase|nr:Xaa-Pro peptidase family protein [Gemmatimonadaceae bacterium]